MTAFGRFLPFVTGSNRPKSGVGFLPNSSSTNSGLVTGFVVIMKGDKPLSTFVREGNEMLLFETEVDSEKAVWNTGTIG